MGRLYVPPELPIIDLSAQVGTQSLILRPVWLPAERQHTHVAATHRPNWPQLHTAAQHSGHGVVVGRCSASYPP